MTMRAASIIGWGTALPPNVVRNSDLEARLDTSDRWIVERTGIRERRVGGSVPELGAEAAHEALQCAGLDPAQIDLCLLATCTPEMTIPASSAKIHQLLGLRCGALDVNAACAGFVYALVLAYGALSAGCQRILVIGADTLSRITDPDDRSTAILFADGAGAVILEATGTPGPLEGGPGLVSMDLGVDSSAYDLLTCPHGGYMAMEGGEVFRRAVRSTVESASSAIERAKLRADDIALFVPHQANLRIIEAAAARLGIPMERACVVLERTGNTSAASIPIALAEAASGGRLHRGDHLLLSGFGAGMSWASIVLRWGGA